MPFQKGNRYGGRRSARTSMAITRTPTPPAPEANDDSDGGPQDETMYDIDNDGELDVEDDANAGAEEDAEGEDDEEDGEEDEIAQDTQTVPRRATVLSLSRRRGGRARGGANRRSRNHTGTPDPGEDYSESGTPRRRRGGRAIISAPVRTRGGFRGRRKGQVVETPRVVIDKSGTTLEVVDDEAIVDQDEAGDDKVDSNGVLKGGREYRVRTFTIMNRGKRLYMLSTEPARCCGFRDSYLFFTKHPKLFKVLITEEEKMDLIAREVLPNSYKGRNIGVVTARSVFREFGARIIVGGRKVIDDYKEADARGKGAIEGELADPDDYVPENREEYNRNRYVAWFGASDVYRQAAGGGQVPVKAAIGKRRTNITTSNWQYQHAREANRFNTALVAARKANLNGVYDTHTNMMFYPGITQPTHVHWEEIPPPPDSLIDSETTTNGATYGGSNGTTHAQSRDVGDGTGSIFHDIPAVISRNFTVVDVVYKAPPISSIGYPGPDGEIVDLTSGSHGLASISPDLIDELPEDCRRAFLRARDTETGWKTYWGSEHQTGLRGALKIGFHGYPV